VAHFVARRIEEGRLHIITDYSRRAMKVKLHIVASKNDLGAAAKQTHTHTCIFVPTGQYMTKF
jgi:ribosomal protein L7Ae-like RNA K-turn-binding protein